MICKLITKAKKHISNSKTYCLLILFAVGHIGLFAQGYSVSGRVVDNETGVYIPNAQLELNNMFNLSNSVGEYHFDNVHPGDYQLIVSAPNYLIERINFTVHNSDVIMADVRLKFSPYDEGLGVGIGDFSLDADDEGGSDMYSGVLTSTSDPYSQAAAYSFSPMYYKVRGYDNEYRNVYMNGVLVNDLETGRAVWNEWGGLNEVVRNKITVDDFTPVDYCFGNIGGSTKINAIPSLIRKQTKFTLSRSNRSYNNRAMLTYSTGMMANNWGIVASASKRWSEEGRTEGTFYDAYAWYLGIERKINNSHSLALVTYGSPFRRGQSAGVTQEVYDLAGSIYYNPNWGYQNGEKRNARVKWSMQPMTMLIHNWDISEKSKLQTTASYTFGKFGRTRLNWYKARDPRPDYYRYLPSWVSGQNEALGNYIAQQWENENTHFTQIDWDRLYQQNYLANLSGKQAVYIIEDEVTDQNQFNLASVFNYTTNKAKSTVGIEFIDYTARNFKILRDLLGGTHWVDIDQFSERDFTGDSIILQNDLDNPNKVIKEGDEFGYNYTLTNRKYNLWAMQQWFLPRFDFYVGGNLMFTQYQREGFMRNGRQPERSLGKSELTNLFTYDFKAGVTYKITGRHYLLLNALVGADPINLRNVYISPRISDVLSANNLVTNILSADMSYLLRFPNLNGRITVFETFFHNHSEIMRFYHDDLRTFVNMSLSGQDRVHQGIEVALQYKLNSMFTLQGSGSFGNYRYTNRAKATLNFENGSRPDTSWMAYTKNFYVSGTPQIASNLTLKFNKNRWFIEAGVNYFDKIYLSFNPERRTSQAIAGLGEGDPLIDQITQQEKLNGGFTVDFSIGKSFRINSRFLSINLNVSNVLNNTSLKSGGYEQLRFDFENKNIDKFPPRYYYMYGTNFFFNIAFSL
ncbi:MAG: carboxypeptidase-like regulatory domain-containing protein [Bacteroidales bacterium]